MLLVLAMHAAVILSLSRCALEKTRARDLEPERTEFVSTSLENSGRIEVNVIGRHHSMRGWSWGMHRKVE